MDLTTFCATMHPSRIFKAFVLICTLVVSSKSFAQSSFDYNSDNASPYSRFGLGTMPMRVNGNTTSMAGAGLGLSYRNYVNVNNPATYSNIDSLTFVLDIGMNLSHTTSKLNNDQSFKHNSAQFSHVNAGFRLFRNLGMVLGFMPYTSIGYDYNTHTVVDKDNNIKLNQTFFGSGGLHQVLAGWGYSPVRNLSLGMNVGFLWGEYNHSTTESYSVNETASNIYNAYVRLYQADIKTYTLDWGAQYAVNFAPKQTISLGATFGLGHTMGGDAIYYKYIQGNEIEAKDTVSQGFEIPLSIGIGVAYKYADRMKVAFDWGMEMWKGCRIPYIAKSDNDDNLVCSTDQYRDRMTFRLGAEYCVNPLAAKYSKRIKYRLGAYYHTPYFKMETNSDALHDGPSEYGITAGLALPISNQINRGSVINFGIRWNHLQPSIKTGMITDNQFMINLGLTFNEQWFAKWKIR